MSVRRVRTTTYRIVDRGVRTVDLANKAITTDKGSPSFVTEDLVADRAVTDVKLTRLTQGGSAVPGYWAFPTGYTTVLGAAAQKVADYDESTYPTRVDRILAGCVHVTGSPDGYIAITAIGDV